MWIIFKTIFKKLLKKLPHKPLTNLDLKKYTKHIPNFRGIFMRNNLPQKINNFESGIINIDNKKGSGTHWTAYVKKNNFINYFDSYGNLRPPTEVISYFNSDGSNKIKYNYENYQKKNPFNCGHLSLKFLYKNA